MILEKIRKFFYKIFHKKCEVKVLNSSTNIPKEQFVNYLRMNVKSDKSKIKTPIYEGDGLGIQKKISC